MRKIKKQNSQVIVLYGAMAVGKLTVGKVLQKKLGYKLTHNHLINNLVLSVFDRNTIKANKMIEDLRFKFYEESAKLGKNLIITHCYAHDYVSPTGLSDPEYLNILEKKLKRAGANVVFVHLQANSDAILKRVKNISRKKHEKLTDVSVMKNYLNTKNFITSAPVKNNLVIDNTNLSPQKVAEIIMKYLKVQRH